MDFLAVTISFFIVLFLISLLGRLVQWRIRLAARSKIAPETVQREAFGVHARAFVSGTSAFKGISSRYLNRVKIDLVLASDRFLMVSSRGTLLDVGLRHGRKFQSVRCTGPQRLVIEGDLPGVSAAGSYRFELVLDDAEAWATALEPLVEPNAETLPFGQLPTSAAIGKPDEGC
jgi:hypothetical protein